MYKPTFEDRWYDIRNWLLDLSTQAQPRPVRDLRSAWHRGDEGLWSSIPDRTPSPDRIAATQNSPTPQPAHTDLKRLGQLFDDSRPLSPSGTTLPLAPTSRPPPRVWKQSECTWWKPRTVHERRVGVTFGRLPRRLPGAGVRRPKPPAEGAPMQCHNDDDIVSVSSTDTDPIERSAHVKHPSGCAPSLVEPNAHMCYLPHIQLNQHCSTWGGVQTGAPHAEEPGKIPHGCGI